MYSILIATFFSIKFFYLILSDKLSQIKTKLKLNFIIYNILFLICYSIFSLYIDSLNNIYFKYINGIFITIFLFNFHDLLVKKLKV
jgi:hypothetical protein